MPSDKVPIPPIQVYYSYVSTGRDEVLRRELENHLKGLEHAGRIIGWHCGEIRAGSVYDQERAARLERAQLILLLISPDFLASQEAYNVEMRHALARHTQGKAVVVPILLRPVLYEDTPFAQLKVLPSNGQPITSWTHRDKAFENVARGLSSLLEDFSKACSKDFSPPVAESSSTPLQVLRNEIHTYGTIQGLVIGENNTVITNFTGQAPQPSLLASAQTNHCDVLLVTATQVETDTVLKAFEQETGIPFKRLFLEEGVYYDLHTIGGKSIFLVQSEAGSGGPGGAILTVEEGIRVLSPSAVLLVGIAYGMRLKDQRMGDILVSRQLLGYELQRVGQDKDGEWVISIRGDRPQASSRLLAWVRSSLIDWTGPVVHVGLLLSGDKLVDNIKFREQLRQLEPEAIGGEMEGVGIYGAAQRKRLDWVVIKAICDWGDGKKGYQKRQRQQIAAENAAKLALHVLRQGG